MFHQLGKNLSTLTRIRPPSSPNSDVNSSERAASSSVGEHGSEGAELALVPHRQISHNSRTRRLNGKRPYTYIDSEEECVTLISDLAQAAMACDKNEAEASQYKDSRDNKVRIVQPYSTDVLKDQVRTLELEKYAMQDKMNELSEELSHRPSPDDLKNLQQLLNLSVSDCEEKVNELEARIDELRDLAAEQLTELQDSRERAKELSQRLSEETDRAHKSETEAGNIRSLVEEIQKNHSATLCTMESDINTLKEKHDRVLEQLRTEQDKDCMNCAHLLLELGNAQGNIEQRNQETQNMSERIERLSFQLDTTSSDYLRETEEHRNTIRRNEDQISRLNLRNTDLELQVRQLHADVGRTTALVSHQQAQLQAKDVTHTAQVNELKQCISSHQEESTYKIRGLEAEIQQGGTQIHELNKQVQALIRTNDDLTQRCATLQECVSQKDEAITAEENMVSVLRQELISLKRSHAESASILSPDTVMDITSDELFNNNSSLPSAKALGKMREVNNPLTPPKSNTPFVSRLISNVQAPSITFSTSQDVQHLTSFQRNALGSPFTPMNRAGTYERNRPAATVLVRPPGASLQNPYPTSQLSSRLFPTLISQPDANDASTDHHRETRPLLSRQPSPGPSGLGPSDEHTDSNPVQETSDQLLAQTIVQGMDRVTKAIGDLHCVVVENYKGMSGSSVHNGSRTFSPFKRHSPRRPRTKDRVDLMRDIRKIMNEMLGIKKNQDIVNAVAEGHFVTADTATYLEHAELEDEGIKSNLLFMKPFWDTLKCNYNALLVRLFTEHFTNEFPEYEEQQDEIEFHFNQRLSGLRKILSEAATRDGETMEEAARRNNERKSIRLRNARVRQRKSEGYRRRVSDLERLVEADPSFATALDVVTSLGVDGYSSDESEAETGGYLVHYLPWRNHKIKPIIQLAIDAHPTMNINGSSLPGAQLRKRIYRHRDPPISHTSAPEGLPRNLYEDSWYNSLSFANQRALNAGPPTTVWDFDEQRN